jgi:arabinose-5-phosphate isomerase
METKGITRDAFAANHPSGRLGRRLTLRVFDIMHAEGAQPTIGPSAPLVDVVGAISDGGLGAVNVIDDEGELLGIVTDGDLRRTLQRCSPEQLAELRAEEIMTRDPVVIDPDAMAYEALRLMEDRPSQIAVLPVVAKGRSVGLVRLHDLVQIGL